VVREAAATHRSSGALVLIRWSLPCVQAHGRAATAGPGCRCRPTDNAGARVVIRPTSPEHPCPGAGSQELCSTTPPAVSFHRWFGGPRCSLSHCTALAPCAVLACQMPRNPGPAVRERRYLPRGRGSRAKACRRSRCRPLQELGAVTHPRSTRPIRRGKNQPQGPGTSGGEACNTSGGVTRSSRVARSTHALLVDRAFPETAADMMSTRPVPGRYWQGAASTGRIAMARTVEPCAVVLGVIRTLPGPEVVEEDLTVRKHDGYTGAASAEAVPMLAGVPALRVGADLEVGSACRSPR